ncbi:GlsB/YeaQ/YmgE family stress response membrane protein [Micromonospora sp. DSM 115977]|uniref:GlsB/YeaQ/YmgE family stress response membrane protein n=1 Tax=Micromonospora reichwaldensis TaxID=3075516 RepID=A0ABU2X443_9ACTN|nr:MULTISPECIES: GlsB/YeaQ/YmgE family stress response membrane protein [unclassified Micromonospora]MDT0532965.1 GlsB/YeaQ/YmgE family stress response membrane protein [Micromonospora sp. DSM 115977]WSG01031.1 GlsB/YeaQ/YmgE family stress response membrane protein [Micromonospora sp. NBC_01740]
MTVAGLLTALAVGLLVAGAGWWVTPRRREVPAWLALVAGIVTALLGVILARIVGLDTDRSGAWRVGVPAASAVVGVALVAATAGPRRAAAPPRGTGPDLDTAQTPPVAGRRVARPDLPWRKTR